MAKSVYQDSAFGIAVYPHLNRPDLGKEGSFKREPLFHVGVRLTGPAAATQKEAIDVAAQAAFDEAFGPEGAATQLIHKAAIKDGLKEGSAGYKKFCDAEKASWSVYHPYQQAKDPESGDPIDEVVFEYKQNAIIKMRDGSTKDIVIGLYDAKGKEMDKFIRGGSEIRVNYSMRAITMTSLKKVGVRLDFSRVQVRKLSEGSAGGGFGAVEGYEDDGFGAAPEEGQTQGSSGSAGDY